MGFFRPEYHTNYSNSHDFYLRNECKVCPLKNEAGADMKPTGSNKPLIYMLGEAPEQQDVKAQRQFVGASGAILRDKIPDEWLKHLRWNNCVRSRPPKNRNPSHIELACCRRSVEADIAETKPLAVFGFGNIPLEWASGRSGITGWSGRYLPVTIAGHTCWFFPLLHPAYVLRSLNERKAVDKYRSELEFAFSKHLEQAFNLVTWLPKPVVHNRDKVFEGFDLEMSFNENGVERIERFVEGLWDQKAVGIDLETNGLRPYNDAAKILTIALSTGSQTLAWPLRHPQAQWSAKHLERLESLLERFLFEAPCRKVAHNAAFEQEWLGYFFHRDLIRAQPWDCTMSQAYILDERQMKLTGGGPLSLSFLIHQHFGFDIKALGGVDVKNLELADLPDVLRYNGPDAKYALLLYKNQRASLKQQGLTKVYTEHMRRVKTMTLTQMKGLPINQKETERLRRQYEQKLEDVEGELRSLPEAKLFKVKTGRHLRPSALDDVHFLLEEILPENKTSKIRDRDGKIPNVNEKTLTQVKHPVTRKVTEWRKCRKVLSTYVEPLLPGSKLIHSDGCAHPVTSTTKTRTWRTSAMDFNYQNWPKRDDGQKDVRAQVDAGKGRKIVSFDYAGIQARNIAMESMDAALIQAFKERYDIHSDWVERIAKVHPRWVKEGVKRLASDKALFKKYRDKVKQEFVFASMFGARGETIAYYIGAESRVGIQLQEDLWARFGGVPKWHERLWKGYRKTGYVTGHAGFRRHAPLSYNELINAPIQADEAIIVCDAMDRLSKLGWAYQANMEIHDDLTFIWPEHKVHERAARVLDVMLNVPYEWAQVVPIGVEVSVGDTWAHQEKLGEYFSDTWKGEL